VKTIRFAPPIALAAALLLLGSAARGEDPTALGPERAEPDMELAFRAPTGVDPGPSAPCGSLGGRSFGFYFGLAGKQPLEVRIETFPFFEDADAFARRRKAEMAAQDRAPEAEAPFAGGGFDRGLRISWKPDAKGKAAVLCVLKRFRRVTAVTCEFPAADREAYATVLEGVLGSLRSTAREPRGLPVPPGWRTEATQNFEITTDASSPVSKALGALLEAALAEARRWFPAARRPEHRNLVLFFGSADGFSRFREEHEIRPEALVFLFEDERVLSLGVLPESKQSRRFAAAEVDILETVRGLFEQFALHAAGRRPEPWFTEGAGLALGAGFGPDLRHDRARAEGELALGVEEALSAKKPPSLDDLFGLPDLGEPEKALAGAWAFHLLAAPALAKKGLLQRYLAALAESGDLNAARAAAFGKEPVTDWSRPFAAQCKAAAAKARKAKR